MMLRKYLQWCCALFARIFTMMLRIICLTLRPQQMFRQQIGLEQRAPFRVSSHVGGRPNGLQLLSHDTMWGVAHKWRSPERSAALMFSMSPIITPDWVSCRLTLTLHVHLGIWLLKQLLMSIPFISRGQIKYSPRCTYMYFISFAKALGPRFSGGQRYFKFEFSISWFASTSSHLVQSWISQFSRPPL